MFTVRRATMYDLLSLSECNFVNVVENYQMKYYFYHLLSWPQFTNVAIDDRGKVCGYSMAKLEDDKPKAGHVTAVGVLRSYRGLGIANKVIKQTHMWMEKIFDCECAYLFVRVTNFAAHALYKTKLGYVVDEVVKGYFQDGEDAYSMKVTFSNSKPANSTPNEAVT